MIRSGRPALEVDGGVGRLSVREVADVETTGSLGTNIFGRVARAVC